MPRQVDVLIITALEDELEAVKKVNEGADTETWIKEVDSWGLPVWYRDFKATNGRPIKFAAAWALGQAEAHAGTRAGALLVALNPDCIAMCGVCAGRPKKVFLGDLVVAEAAYRYDDGKLLKYFDEGGHPIDELLEEIKTFNLDARWLANIKDFFKQWKPQCKLKRPKSLEPQIIWLLEMLEKGMVPATSEDRKQKCPDWQTVLEKAKREEIIDDMKLTDKGHKILQWHRDYYPDGYKPPEFKIHPGSMGTGRFVVVDESIFDQLEKRQRNILALEREASAIGVAAYLSGKRFLVVKGVQDYANQKKDDLFRKFAARASAQFLIAFLRENLRPNNGLHKSQLRIPIYMAADPFTPKMYVQREEESQIYSHLDDQRPVVVWAPYHFGKRWLIKSVVHNLSSQPEKYRVCELQTDMLDEESRSSFGGFLKWIADCLLFPLNEGRDQIISQYLKNPSKVQMRLLIEKEILAGNDRVLVMTLDRADRLLNCDFAEDFFKFLRSLLDSVGKPPWDRFRLIMGAAANPKRMSQMLQGSPFDIAIPLHLKGFSRPELQCLSSKHHVNIKQEDIDLLLEHFGGHPHLCCLILRQCSKESATVSNLLGKNLNGNLQRYLTMLKGDLQRSGLLETLRNIHQNDIMPGENDIEYLSECGLIDREDGKVSLKIPFFRRIFD